MVSDARNFSSKGNTIVSKPFELRMPEPIAFRAILQPEDDSYSSKRVSFHRTRGNGKIQIKCEGNFQGKVGILITLGRSAHTISVEHDFAETSVCRLAEMVHFRDFIDVTTKMVEIGVRIVFL